MGAIDIKRQAPNVARMKMLGASVVAAESGSKTLSRMLQMRLLEIGLIILLQLTT